MHFGRTNYHFDAFGTKQLPFRRILREKITISTHFGRNSDHFDAFWRKQLPFRCILDEQIFLRIFVDFACFGTFLLTTSARNHILGRYRPSRGRYRPFQKPQKTKNILEFTDFSNTKKNHTHSGI